MHDGGLEMLRSLWKFVRTGGRHRSRWRHALPARFVPGLESLESRLAPAVAAFFSPGSGVLSVFGDELDNTITVSRNAAGFLLVNGGAVQILGGTATVANTAQISVFGLGGNDLLQLNE